MRPIGTVARQHRMPEQTWILLYGAGNPLDLLQGNLIDRAVVEFRGAGRLVRGNRLSFLEGAPVLQVGGDSCRPEGMTADVRRQSGIPGTPLDHLEDVKTIHAVGRQFSVAIDGA